jgi:2-hydroxychromene-2-carboxylate isomerase
MVLDFYFDFASGYSYFAARRIEWLAAAHGATVRWHPVLLPALTQVTGVLPSPVVPLKWRYVTRDMARTAQEEAIPFNPSAAFPQMLIAPGRAMLWIRAAHGEQAALAFARTCFQAYYADGVDIADKAVLLGIAEGQGIDGTAFLAGIEDPAIKQQFKQGSEDALAQGVFGVPFVLADGEPFWGYDRFGQLERWLAAAARRAA